MSNISTYRVVAICSIVFMWLYLLLWWFGFSRFKKWQKTRDPQTPRMYVAAVRSRNSLVSPPQPSIYITPMNMPPPKYEAMAPPSYEEVVGIHYPTFTPTTPPTTAAPAQAATATNTTVSNTRAASPPDTCIATS